MSHKQSIKTRKKISRTMKQKGINKGKKNPMFGKKGYWAGKSRPDISQKMSGDNHPRYNLNKLGAEAPNWKGGLPNCINCGKKLKHPKSKRCNSCANTIRHGRRCKYKNIWMRSSWEIKYAKYLDTKGIKWTYEPVRFHFMYYYNKKKKIGTYLPDFYLPEQDKYIEIKGYANDRFKKRFSYFCKQNPEIKIEILNQKKLENLGIKLR